MKLPALVAIDLGAESCRVSLLRGSEEKPEIKIVHRFPNAPITEPNGLKWDIHRIMAGVEEGLRRCAEMAGEAIASVGVDGWGVDYVRVGGNGKPLGNPFCYRDERTVEAEKRVHELISAERLYALTGIQMLRLNTLYQLYADGVNGIGPGIPWVSLPEYITSCLGGERVAEYTNATHTELVSLGKYEWCEEIYHAVGLEVSAAPRLVPTGSVVGRISGPLAGLPAFRGSQLITPACHDTASAIAGIPAVGDDWAFISSGTWSLVGTLLDSPCVSREARQGNFTNLGGAGGKFCFLKNVNGMWPLRQSMEHWASQGFEWSLGDLIARSEELPPPDHLLDMDDPALLLPGNMPGKINAQRRRAGWTPFPEGDNGIPEVANAILHSLAARYAEVLKDIAAITQKKIRRLYIVGGGSKNTFLNRLTAERTGLEVCLGSTESATIGNFAIQLAALEGRCSENGVIHSEVTQRAGAITSKAPTAVF